MIINVIVLNILILINLSDIDVSIKKYYLCDNYILRIIDFKI